MKISLLPILIVLLVSAMTGLSDKHHDAHYFDNPLKLPLCETSGNWSLADLPHTQYCDSPTQLDYNHLPSYTVGIWVHEKFSSFVSGWWCEKFQDIVHAKSIFTPSRTVIETTKIPVSYEECKNSGEADRVFPSAGIHILNSEEPSDPQVVKKPFTAAVNLEDRVLLPESQFYPSILSGHYEEQNRAYYWDPEFLGKHYVKQGDFKCFKSKKTYICPEKKLVFNRLKSPRTISIKDITLEQTAEGLFIESIDKTQPLQDLPGVGEDAYVDSELEYVDYQIASVQLINSALNRLTSCINNNYLLYSKSEGDIWGIELVRSVLKIEGQIGVITGSRIQLYPCSVVPVIGVVQQEEVFALVGQDTKVKYYYDDVKQALSLNPTACQEKAAIIGDNVIYKNGSIRNRIGYPDISIRTALIRNPDGTSVYITHQSAIDKLKKVAQASKTIFSYALDWATDMWHEVTTILTLLVLLSVVIVIYSSRKSGVTVNLPTGKKETKYSSLANDGSFMNLSSKS